MLNETNRGRPADNKGEVYLYDLFSALWRFKKLVISVTIGFALVGIIYSMSLPNVYRAEAILAPADDNGVAGLSAMTGQLGGLASLAGVNLPKGKIDKVTIAIEVMTSRDFIGDFIDKRKLSIPLMASKHWSNGRLVIDDSLYNEETSTWDESLLVAGSSIPSDWDMYNKFLQLMKVKQDEAKGLVTISIDHVSPVIAKNWVDWIVEDLNRRIRQNDISEAQRSVDFLEKQIQNTAVADMQKMFYQLIEKQYQTIMLANVREYYMFNILDKAVIPQDKVKPQRFLIVMMFTMLGFVFSVFLVAFYFFDVKGLIVLKR